MEGVMIAWFMARLIPLGIGAAGLVAVVAWDYARIWKAEGRGEDRAFVKVERNNDKVQQIGRSGSSNAGLPVPGSVRDPGYRDE
jgi:hypothetical protein